MHTQGNCVKMRRFCNWLARLVGRRKNLKFTVFFRGRGEEGACTSKYVCPRAPSSHGMPLLACKDDHGLKRIRWLTQMWNHIPTARSRSHRCVIKLDVKWCTKAWSHMLVNIVITGTGWSQPGRLYLVKRVNCMVHTSRLTLATTCKSVLSQ